VLKVRRSYNKLIVEIFNNTLCNKLINNALCSRLTNNALRNKFINNTLRNKFTNNALRNKLINNIVLFLTNLSSVFNLYNLFLILRDCFIILLSQFR